MNQRRAKATRVFQGAFHSGKMDLRSSAGVLYAALQHNESDFCDYIPFQYRIVSALGFKCKRSPTKILKGGKPLSQF
jgi:hypothetical protein